MYGIRAEHGRTKYGVYDLVFNTEAEFNPNVAPHSGMMPGSTAFIIESSETYMLNTKGKWVLIKTGGVISGGEIIEDEEVIYDGGDIDKDVDAGGGPDGDMDTDDDEEEEVIYDGGDIDKGELPQGNP